MVDSMAANWYYSFVVQNDRQAETATRISTFIGQL